MKFLNKINFQYLVTLTVLLIFATAAGYLVLQKILRNEMREDIFEKEYAIIQEIKTWGILPNIYPIIETKRVDKNRVEAKSYKELYLNDEAEGEKEPYLEYTNTVLINGQYYLIKIRHSLLENDDLLLAIALPLLLLLILIFIISFIVTSRLNKTVWRDFETNLKQIEQFSFGNKQPLKLKESNIEEFDRLNKTINQLTEKLQSDYQSLKEFTENASHEIQTPLSIILLNLEEMLQQDLSKDIFERVVVTINSVKRLSALNKSLLLLSKIENKQFEAKHNLNLTELLLAKLDEFKPLLEKNNISTDVVRNDDFQVDINFQLAEILINNLLSNAIKHNVSNGKILIDINASGLKICNTGKKTRLTNQTIFNRFTKENSQSYGLGLAIVKQICTAHSLQINYGYTNVHCFEVIK